MIKRNVSITYFYKAKKSNIEEIDIGSIVYLKVKSPLNYGIKEWEYYGKITNKTKCSFNILEYCNGDSGYWYTDEITKKEHKAETHTKKWMKKSIIEIYEVDTKNKIETHEFGM